MRYFFRSRQNRPNATDKSSVNEQLQQLADDRSDLSHLWDREHKAHVMSQLTASVESRFEKQTWTAFSRHVLDGVPPFEVAAELGISLSSVFVAKSRILSALRQQADGLIKSREFPYQV